MRHALLGCGGVALLATALFAQTKPSAKAPLRTSWGAPDLQGVWNVVAGTPLERPAAFAGREFLTDEELDRAESELHERADADRRDAAPTLADLRREPKSLSSRRTSLIIDPPDGKLPTLTPEAAKKPVPPLDDFRRADGPEDRSLGERCIVHQITGPPMLALPPPINEQLFGHKWQFQVFQSPNYVAIVWEYVQHIRIIPLDGRPHLPQRARQWAGDSRGRWEGSTLIVETTNFSDLRLFMGLGAESLRVVERFSRSSADALDYQFTVDDPTRWTRPWTAVVSVAKSDGALFEFACHEGNYGLRNILSTARAQERQGAQAGTQPPR